jgi:hypothetical protein
MKLSKKLSYLIEKMILCKDIDYPHALGQIRNGIQELEAGIPTINKMNLAEGDILVLKYEELLPMERIARIGEFIKSMFPDNKCMILEGADIEIISKGEND